MKKMMIRNFALVAHIDHGKSTLADRMIEFCNQLPSRVVQSQILDTMDLERERGITIKAQCVRLNYISSSGKVYVLNLIDTPGHADFFYEVSRSLEACDGVVLIVDSTQGIEAQTISNYTTVQNKGLNVIPVLNKVDVKTNDLDSSIHQMCAVFDFDKESILQVSAKFGIGIKELFECIVHKLPFPTGCENAPLQVLVFDLWFDLHLGVVSLICVKNGCIRVKEKIKVLSTGEVFFVETLGVFTPRKKFVSFLEAGEIGFLTIGSKNVSVLNVGDTITHVSDFNVLPLCGFQKIRAKVYAGFYPVEAHMFSLLKSSLEKLRLNDFSLLFEVENSPSLGFGFRCGFLGTLHMEIIKERLEREYNVDLCVTIPTVTYEVLFTNPFSKIYIDNPTKLSKFTKKYEIREPIALVTIISPTQLVGKIISLCVEKRGRQQDLKYFDKHSLLVFNIPMNEIIIDFYSKIKSLSSGFASVDYKFLMYKKSVLLRLDVLINSVVFDAFSIFVHVSGAQKKGKVILEKLKDEIPKQLFDVIIQIAVNSKIILRETIKALRKDVIDKCYGGDVTRKKKLLEKQKKGKKKMRYFGKVHLPKSVFFSLMKIS